MLAPDPTCYGCLGTGAIVGFSMHGQQCPCVTCVESGCGARASALIDEETGEMLCDACVQFRAEEEAAQ